MILSVLNRYIATRILKGILLAFIVVISIIMLVDFVEGSRNINAGDDITAWTLVVLTALKAPRLIEQTIPFVVLFGVMGALYGLNRRSELIVLRASGLSAWRFLAPALIVTATLGVIWALAFNPLATQTFAAHERLMEEVKGNSPKRAEDGEIWLREGTDIEQTVIHSQKTNLLQRTLTDVTFYFFETDEIGNAVFRRRFDAKRAQLLSSGYWQLTDVTENAEDEITQFSSAISWPTTITAANLRDGTGTQFLPPFWALPGEIEKTEQTGFSTIALKMQFNRLLSLPLTLIAMTFIAAGVSMHLTREGGTFSMMLFGGALGFGVFFADNIISAFGEAGTLPTMLAAWSIPFFVLFCGLAYLTHIEDG